MDACGVGASGMAGCSPGILEKEGNKPVVFLTARWVSNLGLVGWKREYLIGRFNFKLIHTLAGSARENPCLNLKDKGSVAWNDVRRQEPFEDTNGTGFYGLSRDMSHSIRSIHAGWQVRQKFWH